MKSLKISGALLLASMGVIGSGCVGAHQSTFDEISNALGGSKNFTEAFIDYPGPAEQWAGPARFTLHVTTKDTQVSVVIPAQWHPVMTPGRRAVASTMTGDQAREKLSDLATAMAEDSSAYQGCMYPIRVRLIRSDGSVLDKEGCREQSKWSKTASETVDYFIANGVK
jgi:hypothetical protein